MKHTMRVTLILVLVFFLAQIIGLFIIKSYIADIDVATGAVEYKNLPGNMERPELDPATSFIPIMGAVLIGTAVVLILIKLKFYRFWKVWFFLSIFIALVFALGPFIGSTGWRVIITLAVAGILAYYKIIVKNVWVHNGTELIIYGGIAAIFVPIMDLFAASMLLILIAIYDAIAVWQSKHMVKLANFQTDQKLFAGLSIPYNIGFSSKPSGVSSSASSPEIVTTSKSAAKKAQAKQTIQDTPKSTSRNAILGGGDIAFPLIFSGVVMQSLIKSNPLVPWQMFGITLIISAVTSIALFFLLYKAQEDKFYPAMPFLSTACFVGLGIIIGLSYVLP